MRAGRRRGTAAADTEAIRAPVLALLALCLLALLVRALHAPEVFGGDGEVWFWGPDAAYHARRALYSFARFPHVLWVDPYLAYPSGARVPMPPLFDWGLAALGRALGASEASFQVLLAWTSPLLAAATVPVVWLLGRSVAGPRVALGAACLFAVVPAHALAGTVGNVDHHAAVALLGSLQLLAVLALANEASSAARLEALGALLAALLVALALTWSGSALYLGLGQAVLLAAALATRGPARSRLLLAQAASAAAAALALAVFVAVAPEPPGGALSTLTLSWFHVGALLAAGAAGLALAALEAVRARRSARARRALDVALAFAALAGAAALLWALSDVLRPAAAFLAKRDVWGATNLEQRPLLRWPWLPSSTPVAPAVYYGLLGALVPLAWVGPLAFSRAGVARSRKVALAGWLLAFGGLAAHQLRFVHDFAPAGSVGIAMLVSGLASRIATSLPRLRASGPALALAFVGALLIPPLWETGRDFLPRALAFARNGPSPALGPERSFALFAQLVRNATPPTAGFLDATARPEYGILVPPSLGHDFMFATRRPTPAGNFGPYADADKYRRALRFYEATGEAEAFELARSLDVRYVVTTERGATSLRRFADALHAAHGAGAPGAPRAQRFRLVTEGPPGGLPILAGLETPRLRTRMPYRLFEVVEGALLEVDAGCGARATATATILSPSGRRFRYDARGVSLDGRVRLRVPYPTEPVGGAYALDRYRVTCGAAAGTAEVRERDVREGASVPVSLARLRGASAS